jgi:class 3 adenylate cyclase/ActR/RegA family two-component response regulator
VASEGPGRAMNIRVVLGEDNVLVREGVRALLDASDGIEVAGVAADAPQLIQLAEELTPDVVVTDIKMPPHFQLEGIDAAHEIRARHPGTGVVVLSAHDDEAYALALLGKGQSGLAYLLKERVAEGETLAQAIREVAAGGSAIDPTIAERLSGRHEADADDREILDLMAAGSGYAEMAERLHTTQEDIDRRVTDLFERLAGEAGRGHARAVDELKKLHAAVVDREASARALAPYLPSGAAEKIGELGVELQEEVEATILFSDIRGFSTVAETTPARELAVMLTRHLSAMAEVVTEHGGSIDKFAGDAVMAVFGAPRAEPDHAERAVRCAVAMQERQSQLNEEAMDQGLRPLHVGIGVNTGVVVAGTVGGGGRLEYTVLGDAVNVAQRLQSNAAAGEVLITGATAEAAKAGWFHMEPRGIQQVKGRREPVEVFRVLG